MRVIVAEDELLFQEFTVRCLRDEGYDVVAVGSGQDLLAALRDESFDLVLLDLGLPDEDGLVILRQLRSRTDVPVIILTANLADETRLAGLEMGADDYLLKSVSRKELLLRVRNLLRRADASGVAGREPNTALFGSWKLDFSGFVLTDDQDRDLGLTPHEFLVLATLVRAPNRVLSRGHILDAMTTSDDPPTERMIDAFVSRIRRKMGADCPVKTVIGIGYKLEADVRYR